MDKEFQVEDGLVVSMEYTLTVDDEIFDSADSTDPIEFIQGIGNIIPGLERELYGMKIGESKDIVVASEDGYGEIDEESYVELAPDEFPDDIPLEVGVTIEMDDEDDNHLEATIDEVGDDYVVLNFNHPLAGKALHFSIKIAAIREATAEEIEHQHVHYDDLEDEE